MDENRVRLPRVGFFRRWIRALEDRPRIWFLVLFVIGAGVGFGAKWFASGVLTIGYNDYTVSQDDGRKYADFSAMEKIVKERQEKAQAESAARAAQMQGGGAVPQGEMPPEGMPTPPEGAPTP